VSAANVATAAKSRTGRVSVNGEAISRSSVERTSAGSYGDAGNYHASDSRASTMRWLRSRGVRFTVGTRDAAFPLACGSPNRVQ